MKRYKGDFEEKYLGNPFLDYKFKFKNMTIYGKVIEIFDWFVAGLAVIFMILFVMFMLGAAFVGINSIFFGV